MVTRNIPTDVIRMLRAEVGFHCPVDVDVDGEVCGNPYLTWHHFDPPFRIEKHHRPEGMIALCREHADKADNGSFTDDQLRRLKREARGKSYLVRGKFDWMRQDLVGVVGGNAYVDMDVLVNIAGDNVVWFTRNDYGEAMVNFRMPSVSKDQRASIIDNTWIVDPGTDADLICPPNGRKISLSYPNGDYFRVEFRTLHSMDDWKLRFPQLTYIAQHPFNYPITTVELTMEVAGRSWRLAPDATYAAGMSIGDCVMEGSTIAIVNPVEPLTLSNSFLNSARSTGWFKD